jgi:hypothetical protein
LHYTLGGVQTQRVANYVAASARHTTPGERGLKLTLPFSSSVEDDPEVFGLVYRQLAHVCNVELSWVRPPSPVEDNDIALPWVDSEAKRGKMPTRVIN